MPRRTAARKDAKTPVRKAAPTPEVRRSAKPSHLPQAPIVEALLDFRVARGEDVTLDLLASIGNALPEYPVKKTRRLMTGQLDVSDVGQPRATADSQIDGYRFETRDGLRVLQPQLDGFTFSWLKPYKDWPSFRAEAKRLWKVYVQVAAPSRVTRIGLRFVNRFELPARSGELSEWLLTRPALARGIPRVTDLFMRVVFPLAPIDAFAVITEAFDPDGAKLGQPVILDVDVFREANVLPQEKDLWDTVEKFRVEKNRLFFGSITERTKELFL